MFRVSERVKTPIWTVKTPNALDQNAKFSLPTMRFAPIYIYIVQWELLLGSDCPLDGQNMSEHMLVSPMLVE